MDFASFDGIAQAQQTALQAILRVSKAYLVSTERLTALNLSTFRRAMTDSAAVATKIASAGSMEEVQRLQNALATDMTTRLSDYGRSVQEIASDTQSEMVAQFGSRSLGLSVPMSGMPEAWRAALAMVTSAPTSGAPMSVRGHGSNGSRPGRAVEQRVA